MKRPNFFIIGAPKCGTTSLAAWLSAHPQVYMSPMKEPHFFNVGGLRAITNVDDYEALFEHASSQHLAIGEASTHYLFSAQAVSRIIGYNPAARFIVCVRNPIEMAQALHAERVWQGREPIETFEEAWACQAERSKGRNLPLTVRGEPDRLQYGAYCRLGEQLERLCSQISRESLLVLVLDDIAAQPATEYRKLTAFLQLEDDYLPEFQVHNRRRSVRSPYLAYALREAVGLKRKLGLTWSLGLAKYLRRANTALRAERIMMAPEFRRQLIEYFQDDVQRLERLLERDFSAWLA